MVNQHASSFPLIPQADEIPYNSLPNGTEQATVIQANKPLDGPLQTLMEVHVPVGPNSCRLVCPACKAFVCTRLVRTSTSKTHKAALRLLCMVFCCPCACLPYCLDSCKAATHYCPNCHAYLGTYDI